jgi:hypothetical protein
VVLFAVVFVSEIERHARTPSSRSPLRQPQDHGAVALARPTLRSEPIERTLVNPATVQPFGRIDAIAAKAAGVIEIMTTAHCGREARPRAAGVRGDLSEGEREKIFSGHSLRAGLASGVDALAVGEDPPEKGPVRNPSKLQPGL